MEDDKDSINSRKSRIKICFVSSADMTLKFLLLPNLKFLQNRGYELSAVCSPGKWVKDIEREGIKVKTIKIKRKISPLSDLITVFGLYFYFKKEKFNIVHTFTPKAGLLGQVAAKMAGVPIICNTVFGFYFHEGTHFLQRRFFVFFEKIAAKFSDLIFSINKEDIKTAAKEKICSKQKIKYCGIGVNVDRFNPERFSADFIEEKKKILGINPANIVLGIVARLVKEKGYLDLFDAFDIIVKKFPNVTLLIVGINEPEKKDSVQIEDIIKNYGLEKKVLFLGERVDVDEIYPLMDIFVLPSHREGLSVSLLEAQATEKPVVATDIRGCREAVDRGRTGILVSVKNPDELANAIIYLLSNPKIAKEMGKNGRMKVKREFDERIIFNRIEECYQKLVEDKLDKENFGKKFQQTIKIIFDFVAAFIGLIILSPLFLVVAILIKITSPGQIFFRQERVGKNEKIFKIWKFRTMIEGAEKIGLGHMVAENDSRITKVGKFLRRLAIDELPQFINVIFGEMSLVGPRTALPHQIEKYSELERKRFQVKPGMVSLAHIKGWNALSWKERIKLDIWYLENWSICLDFKILFKTAIIVLLGKGQYGENGIVKDYE